MRSVPPPAATVATGLAAVCLSALAREVHIWRAHLGADERAAERCFEELDANERARAERLRSAADRMRYVRAHALLRTILARYVDCDASAVRYVTNAHGKPAIADREIGFNLSHAGDCALIAVAGDRHVGIDVEYCDRAVDVGAIVTSHFSEAEGAQFAAFAAPDRRRAFFRGWTRKEAYLKALGVGLSGDLRSFDVSLAETPTSDVLADRSRLGQAGRWRLAEVAVPDRYYATVCIDGSDRNVVVFDSHA